MSSKEDRIQARIEPELKQAAEIIFSKLGISSGEAIRMFYSQVKLRGGIPFNIRLPNADTIEAMEELNINGRFLPSFPEFILRKHCCNSRNYPT